MLRKRNPERLFEAGSEREVLRPNVGALGRGETALKQHRCL